MLTGILTLGFAAAIVVAFVMGSRVGERRARIEHLVADVCD